MVGGDHRRHQLGYDGRREAARAVVFKKKGIGFHIVNDDAVARCDDGRLLPFLLRKSGQGTGEQQQAEQRKA